MYAALQANIYLHLIISPPTIHMTHKNIILFPLSLKVCSLPHPTQQKRELFFSRLAVFVFDLESHVGKNVFDKDFGN